VTNDGDAYAGSCDLFCATTNSDNSVYAALALEGLKGKTVRDKTAAIAGTIHKAGYDDPISTNPAMVLGGLTEGVTPLGWTYAYSTIGNDGDRVSGTLAPRPGDSPVSILQVTNDDGETIKGGDNDSMHEQVFDQGTVETAKSMLESVVSSGTGTNAQIGAEGQWGKTGTTENNGDAWFCGGIDDEATACVWVGYPDSTTPMETLYNGGPVMGGTFPALIWADVMSAWMEILAEKAAEREARRAAREDGEEFDPSETESYLPPEGETEGYVPPEESEFESTPEPEPEVVEPAPETEVVPEEEGAPEESAPEGGEAGGGVTAG
jgi:penicillin-binding protein 1A